MLQDNMSYNVNQYTAAVYLVALECRRRGIEANLRHDFMMSAAKGDVVGCRFIYNDDSDRFQNGVVLQLVLN
jgi:hypothetical protein